MLKDYLLIFFNITIVLCSILELYFSLFSFVKWIIVVMKYGGIRTQINDKFSNKVNKTSNVNYYYNLQLVTICKSIKQVSNLSVIMEEDDKLEKWLKLSYCGQDCQRIPSALWNMYGSKVHYLDLSYNNIETLKGLENFTRLQELILDNNKLEDNIRLPYMPYLRTLSLNNNKLTDLEGLIQKISDQMPALSYLSILSNKACPNQLSDCDKDDSDYQRYRYFVIYKLRNLRFLDSRRISVSERAEAAVRGEFTRVRRPPEPPQLSRVTTTSTPVVRPMPVDFSSLGKHKGAYGKCRYKYTGKHSEGNRFIVNSDL